MKSCVLQNIPWTPSTMLSVSNNSLSKTLHVLWRFFLPSIFIYDHTLDFQNRVDELPPVDMFVTTTDPMLEPPIITVNTVLSLLAVDYPANKLSCYVSDDGASRLTFYSLLEASKFAKLWVPFCKKYGIQTRAPFRYFSTELVSSNDNSMEFLQEYRKMKVRKLFLVWTIGTWWNLIFASLLLITILKMQMIWNLEFSFPSAYWVLILFFSVYT